MVLTMIITGFWAVTQCNLPTFTEVLEKNTVSIFGVEDVDRTCVFLTESQISLKLHKDTQLNTFSSRFFSALYR
jgi:hypothetical protein